MYLRTLIGHRAATKQYICVPGGISKLQVWVCWITCHGSKVNSWRNTSENFPLVILLIFLFHKLGENKKSEREENFLATAPSYLEDILVYLYWTVHWPFSFCCVFIVDIDFSSFATF